MEAVKTQGMVLRRYDYSENSLLVHFFTREFGKLNTLVKGAKKAKGRFFGKLELCSVVELVVQHRSRSDLHLLTDAALVYAMEPLRLDVGKFAHAMVILELVDSAFEVEQAHPEYYAELVEGLHLLADGAKPLWAAVVLHLKMIHALGLLPAVDSCQECGKGLLGETFFFAAHQGATLCKNCRRAGQFVVIGQPWQIPYLQAITWGDLKECISLAPSDVQAEQFFGWTRKCLDGVVHKRIRSYEFLTQVGL